MLFSERLSLRSRSAMRRSDSWRALAASFSRASIFGSFAAVAAAAEPLPMAEARDPVSALPPPAAASAAEDDGVSASAFGSAFLAAGFATAFDAGAAWRALAAPE